MSPPPYTDYDRCKWDVSAICVNGLAHRELSDGADDGSIGAYMMTCARQNVRVVIPPDIDRTGYEMDRQCKKRNNCAAPCEACNCPDNFLVVKAEICRFAAILADVSSCSLGHTFAWSIDPCVDAAYEALQIEFIEYLCQYHTTLGNDYPAPLSCRWDSVTDTQPFPPFPIPNGTGMVVELSDPDPVTCTYLLTFTFSATRYKVLYDCSSNPHMLSVVYYGTSSQRVAVGATTVGITVSSVGSDISGSLSFVLQLPVKKNVEMYPTVRSFQMPEDFTPCSPLGEAVLEDIKSRLRSYGSIPLYCMGASWWSSLKYPVSHIDQSKWAEKYAGTETWTFGGAGAEILYTIELWVGQSIRYGASCWTDAEIRIYATQLTPIYHSAGGGGLDDWDNPTGTVYRCCWMEHIYTGPSRYSYTNETKKLGCLEGYDLSECAKSWDGSVWTENCVEGCGKYTGWWITASPAPCDGVDQWGNPYMPECCGNYFCPTYYGLGDTKIYDPETGFWNVAPILSPFLGHGGRYSA